MTSSLGRHMRALAAGLAMAAAGASGADAAVIAVMPVKMLDTSGEVADQRAVHDRRLAELAAALASTLPGTGSYTAAVLIGPDEVKAACPLQQTPKCLLALARDRGADHAFFGVVQKSSTLIMQLFATVADTVDGATVRSRELNFRGDNDESWRRMELFLVRELAEPEDGGPAK